MNTARLLWLLATAYLLTGCKYFPWQDEERVAKSLRCGMTPDEVAAIAEHAGATFKNEGVCGYSSIQKRGGVILLAFDGVPKLVFAAQAGLIEPFGERNWAWTVACQDKVERCPTPIPAADRIP